MNELKFTHIPSLGFCRDCNRIAYDIKEIRQDTLDAILIRNINEANKNFSSNINLVQEYKWSIKNE